MKNGPDLDRTTQAMTPRSVSAYCRSLGSRYDHNHELQLLVFGHANIRHPWLPRQLLHSSLSSHDHSCQYISAILIDSIARAGLYGGRPRSPKQASKAPIRIHPGPPTLLTLPIKILTLSSSHLRPTTNQPHPERRLLGLWLT